MIGWLSGEIQTKLKPGQFIIDVHGVGYEVETSLPTFTQLEFHSGQVSLHIHTVVREDALLLFGFLELQEQTLFRALIKVNGVGPKLAMTILSSITPQEFISAILTQDKNRLSKVPGIGKKTAERLVIEMKDALKHFDVHNDVNGTTDPLKQQKIGSCTGRGEAIQALESLGYKSHDVIKLMTQLDDGSKSCEQLVREGLQWFGQRL
ncbi:MAG: Holliday junction branch migration protein RuvA [Legionella sp.]|nr:Holliday junction branch migration protein RuvA [Legionella sp.]